LDYRNLEAAMNVAGVGIAQLGPDGVLQEVNGSLCVLLGYEASDLLGRNIQDFIHPEGLGENGAAKEPLPEDLSAGEGALKCYVRQDGQLVWARVSEGPSQTEEGQPASSVVVFQDMSETKAVEDRCEALRVALERSNRDLKNFAYVASHDLQEPLRMVVSYMKLLEQHHRGSLGAEAERWIAYAADGALRMKSQINDLLAYSRIETDGESPDAVPSEAALADALDELDDLVLLTSAEITHDALPVVLADPAQLAQVFQILIGNAIKFRGSTRPRIHIDAERKGAIWQFSVSDNGIGVDERHFERVFKVFQRLHTAEEYAGNGIGLAIFRKIIERHGGRAWLESNPDGGSLFHFTLSEPVTASSSRSLR
tara:strand:+ start:1016 stop:2122 length:1107 start_codon:yes stop_codon:yes gene_type:complete